MSALTPGSGLLQCTRPCPLWATVVDPHQEDDAGGNMLSITDGRTQELSQIWNIGHLVFKLIFPMDCLRKIPI